MDRSTLILLDASVYKGLEARGKESVTLAVQDRGDAYVQAHLLGERHCLESVLSSIFVGPPTRCEPDSNTLALSELLDPAKNHAGQFWTNGKWLDCQVQFANVNEDLHSRLEGLFETEALRSKTVLIIGLGSGGSPIAIELAKSGVGAFVLVDHDRLEVHNVVRHSCGVSDLGRYKTKALRDLILEKNPNASITCFEEKVVHDWQDVLAQQINKCDLVLCCTDNRESRLLVNSLTFAANRTAIYGGAFRRAFGGQVVAVRPGETFCYQCFVDLMPEEASNQEIASEQQAEAIAYADMPVPVEPGLSNDILPISQLCVKLAISELLKGSVTSLKNLEEDLRFSWYLWLNRREVGTQWEDLPPMETDPEAMKILSWYGVEVAKNPACPVCGDFLSSLGTKHGFDTHAVDTTEFEAR